jgi:hypothetical protein
MAEILRKGRKIMSKSKADLIANNDFENAKIKFENANGRWKSHWFDCCQQIMNNCREWAKKYIIDPITMTIKAIGEMITKIKPKKDSTSHTYLIKMFDTSGNWIFTKIGKADVIQKRMNDFKNHEYKRNKVTIGSTEIIKEYELPNDDMAQILESFMRNFFRKTKSETYYPNDRFDAFEPTAEDLDTFEKYYQLTLANA